MDSSARAAAIHRQADAASLGRSRVGTRLTRQRQPNLTDAQRRIMTDLVEGYSQKEVAARHGLSRETVRSHLARLKARHRARSIVQLVAHLVRLGLLTAGLSVE